MTLTFYLQSPVAFLCQSAFITIDIIASKPFRLESNNWAEICNLCGSWKSLLKESVNNLQIQGHDHNCLKSLFMQLLEKNLTYSHKVRLRDVTTYWGLQTCEELFSLLYILSWKWRMCQTHFAENSLRQRVTCEGQKKSRGSDFMS